MSTCNIKGCAACDPTRPNYWTPSYTVTDILLPKDEPSIDLTYQGQVIRLAQELVRQFTDLDSNTALKRANEIIRASEKVDAMYLDIMEDDDQ